MTTATAAVTGMPPALSDVLRSLQVEPGNARLSRGGRPGGHTYLVLPSVTEPNLLVPFGAAGATVVRERAAHGLRRRAVRRVVGAALRTGLLSAAPVPRLHVEDPHLDELTAWLTDGAPGSFRLGIMLGPPRANRKAVVRVLGDHGATLGYAKVGSTPLTRALVRAEARNLRLLEQEPPVGLQVPAVLRFRDEDPLTVLLISPLAAAGPRRPPETLPHRETRDLFLRHADDSVPVAALEAFSSASYDVGPGLAALHERVMAVVGDRRLPVGDSHGDWAPQNMALNGRGLAVWDWERHARDVPQGLDAVHFEAFHVDTRSAALARTEARFLADLPATLERCGLDPATTPALLCLYLLWVARRYQADLDEVPSGSTESRLRWATRLLETQLRTLESRYLP